MNVKSNGKYDNANERCHLIIEFDGKNNTLEYKQNTTNLKLIGEGRKLFKLFVENGIGNKVTIYYKNNVTIHYFIVKFHEKPKSPIREDQYVNKWKIPLNSNSKYCMNFDKMNKKEKISLKCKYEGGNAEIARIYFLDSEQS